MTATIKFATGFLRRLATRKSYVPPEEAAYRRLAAKGFRPAAIIDVGAYHGDWTRLARHVFGPVPGLMVEAQPGKAAELERMCDGQRDLRFVSAVLGSASGQQVTFYEMETGSSLLPERSNVERARRVLVTRTLDEIAGDLPGPLFLKIDVQGAELQVLSGAAMTLGHTALVQLEIALLPYNEGAPTFLEVIRYMDDRGFVPFDIAGFSRPTGNDLAQIDVLFVDRESPLRLKRFEF